MTLSTLGMAREFAAFGIAVNSLWPRTMIDTAAIEMLLGAEARKHARRPEIVAEAAYQILITPSRELTGQTLLDEEILSARGEQDFSRFACDSSQPLSADLFVAEADG